ncbi:MAG: ABC transporter ATP-binding protein [Planctomycetota bacterium]
MFQPAAYRFIWPYLRDEWRAYVGGVFLILTTSFFVNAVPWLVGKAIGCLQSGIRTDLVDEIALAMIGAVLLRGLSAFWMRRTMISASRRIEFRFRNHLFRHIESQDAGFFTNVHTGDLISRFTSDVDAVRSALGPGIMYSINTAFTLAFALAIMFSVSVPLTLYSLVPLAVLTWVIRHLGPKVHQASLLAQERLADLSTLAQENFAHVKLLKSHGREDAEVQRMRTQSDAYFDQSMQMVRLRGWTNAWLWLFGDLVVLFLLVLGGAEIIRGEVSLGDFAAFKGCQLLLVWPMIALGWVMMLFQRGAASAQRLSSLLETQPAVNDAHADPAAVVSRAGLRFEKVTFGYGNARPVLEDIDLEVAPGQTLGIVGPTGCGKTTLLQLIARLQPVTTGRILVDGRPIEQYPLAALRDAVGYVPQEPFLFSATVRENLSFGVDAPTDAQIGEVSEVVRIRDEILGFPDGYEQRVGERGITLSGGQKQRVALARALLKRPRILLLDDVLSAVDAATETEILAGLRRFTSDLTTVIVSHRLSAVRHAAQIVVLRDSHIVERGTHDALLSQGGYYAELYRRQSLEDELERL